MEGPFLTCKQEPMGPPQPRQPRQIITKGTYAERSNKIKDLTQKVAEHPAQLQAAWKHGYQTGAGSLQEQVDARVAVVHEHFQGQMNLLIQDLQKAQQQHNEAER